jgi:hypothetical protein
MDLSWIQVLVIIGANIGFSITIFLWLRTEGNADRRENTHMMVEMFKHFHDEIKEIKK